MHEVHQVFPPDGGSPTILVGGVDPFAGVDGPLSLACRLYRGIAGVEPAPTVEQLDAMFRV